MSGCSDGSCSSGTCGGDDKDRLPPGMLSRYNLNQETGLGTLIWAEIEDGNISESVIEMLGMIREDSDDRIFAMITGDVSIKPLYDVLFSYGVDTLYHIRNKDMETFDAANYAEALADLAERIDPAVIMISATDKGMTVAEELSQLLKKPVLENCISVKMEKNTLSVTRNIPDSRFHETDIHLKFPIIAEVLPGSHSIPEKMEGRKGTAISRPFKPSLHQ